MTKSLRALVVATVSSVTLVVSIQPVFADKFGSQPYADVLAWSNQYASRCPSLNANKLAALMVVPALAETGTINTNLTPSPMIVGRYDLDPDAYPPWSGPEPYFNRPVRRAFWHTGVGLWQLDDSGPGFAGAGLPIGARISSWYSAERAADIISSRWCQNSTLANAWQPWFACSKNNTTLTTCTNKYNAIYNVNGNTITLDPAVTREGGMQLRTCQWTFPGGPTFTCFRIDFSLAQGHTGNWTGTVFGGGVACGNPVTGPLSVPLESWWDTAGPWEHRVWLAADLGFGFKRSSVRGLAGGWSVRGPGTGACTAGPTSLSWGSDAAVQVALVP